MLKTETKYEIFRYTGNYYDVIMLYIHSLQTTTSTEKTSPLKTLEEMFSQYYIHSDIFIKLNMRLYHSV